MTRTPSTSTSQEEFVHSVPSASCRARVTICHPQLRDLIACPNERGFLHYVNGQALVHQDILSSDTRQRTTSLLSFEPNCIAAGHGLLAAGGQSADIFVAYDPSHPLTPDTPPAPCHTHISHASINNAMLITSSLSSSVEPSLIVSNNDCTVKVFDIATHSQVLGLEMSGELKYNTPINHASVSPDGRTMLTVGDTNQVFLHNISGGSTATFQRIATYAAGTEANFSTAFSASGVKFAVACQDGSVTVWDVRSSVPLARYQTTPQALSRDCGVGSKKRGAWLWDEPSLPRPLDSSSTPNTHPHAARALKFSPLGADRELLVFTSATDNLHIIDARTFTDHQIIALPQTQSHTSQHAPAPQNAHRSQRSFSMREPSIGGVPATTPEPSTLNSSTLNDIAASESDCGPTGTGTPPRYFTRTERPESNHYVGFAQRWEEHRYANIPAPEFSTREISGVCFDPTGGWLYVGTKKSLIEYPVCPGWDIDSEPGWLCM